MRKIPLLIIACSSIFLCNCDGDKSTNPNPEPEDYDLISVPAVQGYLMGWDGLDVDIGLPIHPVTLDQYSIGKYEVTYALWSEIKTWAESNGYVFAHYGQQGDDPINETTDQHPVVNIDWRDCIAWCNAYSEKEGLTPVYYTDGSHAIVYR